MLGTRPSGCTPQSSKWEGRGVRNSTRRYCGRSAIAAYSRRSKREASSGERDGQQEEEISDPTNGSSRSAPNVDERDVEVKLNAAKGAIEAAFKDFGRREKLQVVCRCDSRPQQPSSARLGRSYKWLQMRLPSTGAAGALRWIALPSLDEPPPMLHRRRLVWPRIVGIGSRHWRQSSQGVCAACACRVKVRSTLFGDMLAMFW